jgi:hypothetical protein
MQFPLFPVLELRHVSKLQDIGYGIGRKHAAQYGSQFVAVSRKSQSSQN